MIARPPPPDMTDETLKKYKNILETVKDYLETLTDEMIENELGNDLMRFLGKLGINIDDYEEALKISTKGKIVVLKRTIMERNVNNYNPEWMLAWQGNHDIQFCYDNFAVVTYCTDYLSKGDDGVTLALKKALNETKGCNDFERLNFLKKTYLTHRQCSVAEAAYRLGDGMYLKASSVKSIFLTTGYPENRSSFYQKVKDGNDVILKVYDNTFSGLVMYLLFFM